jgi:small subunit ribosomal protein S6
MRVYEELFIIKPDAPEEETDALIEQIKQVIITGKGTVDKAEKWGGGVRRMAYKIQRYSEGLYILFQFTAPPELVKEVERRLRVTDLVIKFINIRIDEKQKKIEKRKKQREKRAARKPPPMAASPQAPAAPAMPGEAVAAPGVPGPAHPMPAAPAPAAPAAVAAPVPAEEKETPQE